VKEGQTLAVLEVPELAAELSGADAAVRRAKEQIRQAQGDVQRAKSAHDAAHAMADRVTQASQQRAGLVAQQEVDDARAKDLEAEAQVSSSQAALSAAEQAMDVAVATQQQYQALSSYLRITAPFAGVITVRYADTGSLISAGTASSTQSTRFVWETRSRFTSRPSMRIPSEKFPGLRTPSIRRRGPWKAKSIFRIPMESSCRECMWKPR
jgi:multidrug resistance efflux pump